MGGGPPPGRPRRRERGGPLRRRPGVPRQRLRAVPARDGPLRRPRAAGGRDGQPLRRAGRAPGHRQRGPGHGRLPGLVPRRPGRAAGRRPDAHPRRRLDAHRRAGVPADRERRGDGQPRRVQPRDGALLAGRGDEGPEQHPDVPHPDGDAGRGVPRRRLGLAPAHGGERPGVGELVGQRDVLGRPAARGGPRERSLRDAPPPVGQPPLALLLQRHRGLRRAEDERGGGPHARRLPRRGTHPRRVRRREPALPRPDRLEEPGGRLRVRGAPAPSGTSTSSSPSASRAG